MTSKTRKIAIIAGAFVGLSGLGTALVLSQGAAPPAPPPLPEPVPTAVTTEEAPPAPQQDPTHATVVFAVSPAVGANVSWGKKRLGRILPGKPLVVVRPRDSGPLDVMVRAAGYLPVQTRAHTFADNRVVVKLTPLDKISEVLGYRAPIEDAGVDQADQAALNAVADGGVAQGTAAPLAPIMPTP